MGTLFGKFPFLKKLFADGGYQGPIFKQAQKKAMPDLETEIVKRSDTAVGFEIIPRRWVVERTFAWLGRRLFMLILRGVGIFGELTAKLEQTGKCVPGATTHL